MIDDTPDFPSTFIMITLNSDYVSLNLYREWLISWANEVHDMSRIVGIALFVELSAVVTEGEQTKGTAESIRTPRETARLASQARQIMS